jgi:tetratricopeptide (TPR) repeat protein
VTTSSFGSTAATVVIAVVLIAGAARLQAVREARYPPPTAAQETLYLRSGTTARRLAGAYASLTADAYWIRTLQYYGVRKLRLAKEAAAHLAPTPESYELLYPMLDLTTTLDPRFSIAYRFGSVFLSEPYPSGPGRPDLAIALLEKGSRVQPDKWAYLQDIGFVYYWYEHDYRAAAEAFRKGSEMPGAPWWLKSLAATTLASGGDRQSSRLMWESIRQSAETDWLRADAERRLTQLRALDDIDALERVVNDYRRRAGQPPAGWPALVRAGMLRGVPLDPAGTPYELAPDGHATLSRASPLSPLPTEPVGQIAPPR